MNAIEQHRLSPILNQLESLYDYPEKKNRNVRVNQIYDEISLWRGLIPARVELFQRNFSEKPSENKEKFQNELIAHMLISNRKRLKDNYSLEKETRQIEAILSLLEGKHLHMGTGEGKSSVVLPIATIVEALTSEKKSAVLSTINDKLLNDLETNVNFFVSKLPEPLAIERKKSKEESPEMEKTLEYLKKQKENLDRQMVKDVIMYGDYKKETKKLIRDYYWEKKLLLLPFQSAIANETNDQVRKPKIVLCQENDLVFDYMKDREKFIKDSPAIFMDEAHVPYDRKTPYVLSGDMEIMTPNEIKDNLITWLTTNLIKRNINPSDINQSGGVDELKDEKYQWLLEGNFLPKSIDDHQFSKTIGVLAEKLGAKPIVIKSKLFKLIKEFYSIKQEEKPDFILDTIINKVGQLFSQKGLSYEEDASVRDSYLGVLLKGHKFSTTEQVIVDSLLDRFTLVPTTDSYSGMTHYETFLHDLSNQIIAVSGTLKIVDPKTREIIESPFARFLRDITDREIEVIKQNEFKNIPAPFFTKHKYAAEYELIENLKKNSNKTTLVACFNESDAEEMTEKLIKEFGEEKVARIDSFTSDENEQEIYKKLANGELAYVVAAGRAGVGVDIKKSDGTHPDLRIAIFGLPQSRLQLMQILGRRRLKGNDALWYLSKDHINEALSLTYEKTNFISNLLGKKTLKKYLKYFESIGAAPADKDMVLDMIRNLENSRQQDDDNLLIFDHLFTESFLPYARLRITNWMDHFQRNKQIKNQEYSGLAVDFYNLLQNQCRMDPQFWHTLSEGYKKSVLKKDKFRRYKSSTEEIAFFPFSEETTESLNLMIDGFAEELLEKNKNLENSIDLQGQMMFVENLRSLDNQTLSFVSDPNMVKQPQENIEYGYVDYQGSNFLSCRIKEESGETTYLVTGKRRDVIDYYIYDPSMKLTIKHIKELDKNIVVIA